MIGEQRNVTKKRDMLNDVEQKQEDRLFPPGRDGHTQRLKKWKRLRVGYRPHQLKIESDEYGRNTKESENWLTEWDLSDFPSLFGGTKYQDDVAKFLVNRAINVRWDYRSAIVYGREIEVLFDLPVVEYSEPVKTRSYHDPRFRYQGKNFTAFHYYFVPNQQLNQAVKMASYKTADLPAGSTRVYGQLNYVSCLPPSKLPPETYISWISRCHYSQYEHDQIQPNRVHMAPRNEKDKTHTHGWVEIDLHRSVTVSHLGFMADPYLWKSEFLHFDPTQLPDRYDSVYGFSIPRKNGPMFNYHQIYVTHEMEKRGITGFELWAKQEAQQDWIRIESHLPGIQNRQVEQMYTLTQPITARYLKIIPKSIIGPKLAFRLSVYALVQLSIKASIDRSTEQDVTSLSSPNIQDGQIVHYVLYLPHQRKHVLKYWMKKQDRPAKKPKPNRRHRKNQCRRFISHQEIYQDEIDHDIDELD